MPETSPGSDATMYAGSGEIRRDYVDKMLLAALQEAQSVVRSYDSKAQIVGVGYILALNVQRVATRSRRETHVEGRPPYKIL